MSVLVSVLEVAAVIVVFIVIVALAMVVPFYDPSERDK